VRSKLLCLSALTLAWLVAPAAHAISLGNLAAGAAFGLTPGAGDWSYASRGKIWTPGDGSEFDLFATSTTEGVGVAYLTVSGLMGAGQDGSFDITVSNGSVELVQVGAGSLFNTQFQTFRLTLDDPVSSVLGGSFGGARYVEQIRVAVHAVGAGVSGLGFEISTRPGARGGILRVRGVVPDAGRVPEPGAVGVFSVGLLVAGALIRALQRPS
jgi:hypothetical protein